MKSSLCGLLVVLFATGLGWAREDAQTGAASPAAPPDAAAPLRVMSFNLRYNNPADGPDAWPHRKDMAASMIHFHRADLVGVQEARLGMIEDLQERLPAFDWFGLPRSTGGASDEYSAIFYRTDRLERLDHGTFWLSQAPGERGSVGWDAALPRIVTWGRFRDRASGETFFHFNTHFDHRGDTARVESARLLRRRSQRIAGAAPTLVTGDFNAEPDSAPYAAMTREGAVGDASDDAPAFRDALEASAQPHHGPRSTWNGFEAIAPGRRIDFIFTRGGVRVLQHGILTDAYGDGVFPSDHFPVLATVRWQ